MRGVTIAVLVGAVIWALTVLNIMATYPVRAAGIIPPNAPMANSLRPITVATVVFDTPPDPGADSHVYPGTLDEPACQAALHGIMTEWPDLRPLVGFCVHSQIATASLRPSLAPTTQPWCMQVQGLERAKRGCV